MRVVIASLFATLTLGAAVAGVNLAEKPEPKEKVVAAVCGTLGSLLCR